MSAPKDVGQWEKTFDLKNVCIHASLLPTGKVLYWGRRSDYQSRDPKTLDEQLTLPFIWDPSIKDRANASTPTASKPVNQQNVNVNLFCSGHCFQPDGKLLVVGGHKEDGIGITQTCLYDPDHNKWIAQNPLTSGRWYPSALTLPDGRALAISGSSDEHFTVQRIPQILNANAWGTIAAPTNLGLYPRLYLDKNGKVFMAGPQAQPEFLKDLSTAAPTWEEKGPLREAGVREYAASVLYDVGKVMYTGGGTDPPTDMTEIIDLNVDNPKWKPAKKLGAPRQQANATVLPDGTVLVTGGTRGAGFNNVGKDEKGNPLPVHVPELWNPDTDIWTKMAPEDADRCYHSIALLLPDGKVLSAGGGEWAPTKGVVNPDKDSLKSAQIFTPPYLFDDKNQLATRPTISMPKSVFDYGERFDVTVGANDKIKRVSWIRLGSITHCTNFNQAVVFQTPQQANTKVTIQAPANANIAPPGHYMLFVLNQNNVPAVAPIVCIKVPPASTPSPPSMKSATPFAKHIAVEQHAELNVKALDEKIISEQERPPVVVGLTASCPYGLGPCWGGAFEALKHISDVEVVRPLPNHHDSLAFVYTKQDILPDIDLWWSEFQKINASTHTMRGIEMTLLGAVSEKELGTGKQLTLAGTSTRLELVLEPFQATSKIEWDLVTTAPKPSSDAEAGAYARLLDAVAEHPGARMQVTGRLQKHGADKYSLEVREFEVVDVLAT